MNKFIKKIILVCLLFVGLGAVGFVAFQFLGNKAQDTQRKIKSSAEPNVQPNNPRPDEFSNGQKYKVFTVDDFEVKYPYWQDVDLRNTPNTENIKLAVTDRGCVFMIKVSSMPADTTFKAYAEKLLQDQSAQMSIKILIKDISESKAHLEGEVVLSGVTMKNISNSYLTSKNQSAGFAFVADKNKFDEVCQPIVDEVFESVVIK